MRPDTACATCEFYSPSNVAESIRGQCRRRAPVLDRDGERIRTIWPITFNNSWCGEHSGFAGPRH